MNKYTKRKLQIVLISFVIILIPLSYVIFAAIRTDYAYTSYRKEFGSSSDNNNEKTIRKIDYALSLNPWNKALLGMKVDLLLKNKQYRVALDCIKETEAFLNTGLLYEYLDNADSAKMYYEKEIYKMLGFLDEYDGSPELLMNMERQLALIYKIIGDDTASLKYLRKIPDGFDYHKRISLQYYDFYIESYVGGGYRDFIFGEIIKFDVDNISKNINTDSLITANRFYFKNKSIHGNKFTYEIRKVFEQKALKCGMNKIE